MNILWNDNRLQFARLISELQVAGAFTNEVITALEEATDLSKDEIFELIERADKTFELAKLST